MTLKVVEPIEITEAVLTASDIPEPDASVGEVEWENRQVPTYIGGDKDRYTSVTANDGNVYSFGTNTGDILKIDINNQTSLLIPSISGKYYGSVLGGDGKIYSIRGSSGDVIKFDTSTETSSIIISGLPTGVYLCDLGGDGNIYAVRSDSTSEVFKIDIVGLSWASLGTFSGTHDCAVTGNDGNFYAISNDDFLFVNITTGAVRQIGGYFGLPFFSATAGADNKIYAVGYNQVMEIDTSDLSFSFFGNYSSIFRSSNLGSDGNIYCFSSNGSGLDNEIMLLDTASKSVTIIGYSPNNHHTSSVGGDGSIYCPSSDSNDILKITPRYKVGDRVALTSEHKQYQCLVGTYENPKIGATEDSTATWIKVGPTNKWAMFDGLQSTKTSNSTDFTITLNPETFVNTLAIFGFKGVSSVRIEVDNSLDVNIYDKTYSMNDFSSIYDHYTYAFYQISSLGKFIATDLPPLPNTTIRVTFSGSDMTTGELVTGFAIDIGQLVAENTKSDRFRYREQEYNEFGYPTGKPPIVVELNTYDVLVPKLNNQAIQKLLDALTGENTLWVGDIGGGQSLVTYGFFERSPIPYSMPNHINYQITVRASV